jgi:predicted house-cleaning noncanonical NTP pyrophosphatase (MazG superfamily)
LERLLLIAKQDKKCSMKEKLSMAKKYNKLVRDKVLEILDARGIKHTDHIADESEYEEKLFAKLLEEAKEVVGEKDPEKQKSEIADLLEVIEAIKILRGYITEEIEIIRLEKLATHGGFTKRIILEES